MTHDEYGMSLDQHGTEYFQPLMMMERVCYLEAKIPT